MVLRVALAVSLVVMAPGCRAIFGLDPPVLADGGVVLADHPAADSTDTCLQRWQAGTVRLSAPQLVSELDTAAYQRDPFLTADGLTIYLSSNRAGGIGSQDIWVATRAGPGAAFSTPVVEPNLSSTGSDSKMSVTDDGLIAVLASNRGAPSKADIYMATRTTAAAAFGAPSTNDVFALDSAFDDFDPYITGEGLAVYYAPTDGAGTQHISVATRTARTLPFGAPSVISALSSSAGESDPTLTADRSVILFSSNRTGGLGGGDIFYAIDGGTGFGAAMPVPDIASTADDADPTLGHDACTLYFSSNRAASTYEIYVAQVVM